MIHIWNFEELSKIVGLEVILDGWCLRVTFTHKDEDWEEFIEFSSQQTYDSYVDALYRHKVNMRK